jgi:hypothetical protein
MNFYRRKRYDNKKEYRIEIFFKERWRSMTDYLVPYYLLKSMSPMNRSDLIEFTNKGTTKWVRDLLDGSLYCDIKNISNLFFQDIFYPLIAEDTSAFAS